MTLCEALLIGFLISSNIYLIIVMSVYLQAIFKDVGQIKTYCKELKDLDKSVYLQAVFKDIRQIREYFKELKDLDAKDYK